MKSLLLLGSTGSIGSQTLDLVREDRGELRVRGLAARHSWWALAEQAREFRPALVAVEDEEAGARLAEQLPAGVGLRVGPGAAEELARELADGADGYDLCIHGMVGAAGLRPSVAVLEAGKILALANKESMVIAGAGLMALCDERGGEIVPVDSEHSAIYQCLRGEEVSHVRRILLTASGGPFRDFSAESLEDVTPAMALEHPNWTMGPRITVGSATLMNKALEVIEVHHLFGVERERIEVVIHPQSIVHSMVEFVDGSVIALRFDRPDPARFPALDLGFRCVEEGADSGSVLNAADEVAVGAFLEGRIRFTHINRINTAVLGLRPGLHGSVDQLLEADRLARDLARGQIAALGT